MILRETINIQDDKLTRGIGPVVKIMSIINNCEDEEVIVDCSTIRFTSPVFVISLMLCLFSCKKKVSIINCNNYLEAIYFYYALRPDEIGTDRFHLLLEKYHIKTYIPVISFPALANRSKVKDAILSSIENLLCRQQTKESHQKIYRTPKTAGMAYIPQKTC